MTKTTTFVWDPVFDCVISELDGSNNVQAVYTNEPQQYGGVISQRRGTITSTLHADALGNTRALTDSSETVTDTYLYDAWGNEVASTGTTVNPFRWVGRYGYYTDTLTGLVYVRARMYQPNAGRWLSVDPVWPLDGVNEYLCVHNRLSISVDPSGKHELQSISTQLYPEEGCKKICDEFRARKNPIGGHVVCFGGLACPCNFGWSPAEPGRCPDLDAIITEHEESHLSQMSPCPETCEMVYATFDKTKVDPIKAECDARNKTVKQIAELLQNAADERCITAMKNISAVLKSWLKDNKCLEK